MKSTRIPASYLSKYGISCVAGHIWKILRCEISGGARTIEKPDYFQANGLLTVGEGESETVSLNCSRITLLFPRIYLLIAVIIYKQFFFTMLVSFAYSFSLYYAGN